MVGRTSQDKVDGGDASTAQATAATQQYRHTRHDSNASSVSNSSGSGLGGERHHVVVPAYPYNVSSEWKRSTVDSRQANGSGSFFPSRYQCHLSYRGLHLLGLNPTLNSMSQTTAMYRHACPPSVSTICPTIGQKTMFGRRGRQ